MALTEEERFAYIEKWAARRDQEDPSFKIKLSHKFRDKMKKWKKPRNVADVAYKGVMTFCPPGLSHAIDWTVEKGKDKLKEVHHERKAANAEAQNAGDTGLESEGKKLKHQIKKSYEAFDHPAKKVRDALAAYQELDEYVRNSGGNCITSKEMMRSLAYYQRRVRIMREATDDAKILIQRLDEWVKMNEKLIHDIYNPFHDWGIRSVVSESTDHPESFCHEEKCLNWNDEDTKKKIQSHDHRKDGKVQKTGRGKGYQKFQDED